MKFFLALLTPIVVMVSANYLVVRLNQDLSLDQDLQLDVYFPSNACERAAENSDQLLNTLEHFLLISNCYHSDSFKRSGNKWRFEHLVPPGIHRKNAYNNGFELGKWLQSKERRGEKWSIEKLNRFEVFNHDNPEYIVHTLHFLCAHPDFTWQLHKPSPKNSWQKNQYALLSKCQEGTGYEQQMGITTEHYHDSLGEKLLYLTNNPNASTDDLDAIIQDLID